MENFYYALNLDTESLRRDAEKAKREINSIGGAVDRQSKIAGKSIDSLGDKFSGLASAVGIGLSIEGMRQFGTHVIEVTGKFQTFRAVLENTFGDVKMADNAMKMISDFAATTPFQVDELTGAFVKLANQGFAPTKDQMVLLGDVASSTGKGFDQLAEAIIDAQVGEMERLKEFGIRASQEGDKVTFTFKEQQTVVENNASSIRDYILSLGELEGVQGANAKIAEILTGQMSNLQDTITAKINEIGQSNSGMLSDAIGAASYLVENYEEIGKVIGTLVVGYGSYRAALIAVAAVQKAQALVETTQSFLKMTSALRRTTQAQILLNKAVGANPYVKLASVVIALGTAIWAFSSKASKAEESMESFNAKNAEAQAEAELLFDRLKKLEKGSDEYNEAQKRIIDKYPDLLQGQADEAGNLLNIEEAYKSVVAAIQSKIAAESQEAAQTKIIQESMAKQMSWIEEIQSSAIGGKIAENMANAGKSFSSTIIQMSKDGKSAKDIIDELNNYKPEGTKGLSLTQSTYAGRNNAGVATDSYEAMRLGWIANNSKEANQDLKSIEDMYSGYIISSPDSKKKKKKKTTTTEDEVKDPLIEGTIAYYKAKIAELNELNHHLTDATEISANNAKIGEYEGNIKDLDGTTAKEAEEKRKAEELKEKETLKAKAESYKAYMQEVIEIERDAAQQIEEINKQKEEGGITEEEATERKKATRYSAEIELQDAAEEHGISEEDETSGVYAIVDETIKQGADIILQQLEILENSLEGIKDPKQKAKVTAQLKALKKGMKEAATGSDDDAKKTGNSIADKYEMINDVMSTVNSTVDEVKESFGDLLGEAGGDAIGVAQQVASTTVGMISLISTTAWTGAEAVKGVEKASVILAIISMAIQALNAIINVFVKYFSSSAKLQAEIDKSKERVDALNESYKESERIQEKMYGAKWAAEQTKQLSNLKNQQAEYNRQLALANEQMDKAWTKKQREKAQENIDAANEGLKDTADEMASLLEETIERLGATDLKSFAQDMAESLVDGWEDGLSGMNKAFDETLDNLIKQMLTARLAEQLMTVFDGSFKMLESFLGDNQLTEGEMSQFLSDLEASKGEAANLSEAMRQVYEALGIDSGIDQYTQSKGFEAMTQDTADELNGRFTALQMHGASIEAQVLNQTELAKEAAAVREDIRDSMFSLSEIAEMQLQELQQINANTSLISETNNLLRSANHKLSKL